MDKYTLYNYEIYGLGRRPGEQGPCPLLSNQDRVGKLATEKEPEMEEPGKQRPAMEKIIQKKIQMRKVLPIEILNVRSMIQLGRVHMLGMELEKNKVDIILWSSQG